LVELPVPVTPASDVERITDEVLSRPEFLDAQPSWLQQALRWLADVIGRFLDTVGQGQRGSTIGTIALVVAAVALVTIVIRTTRGMRRDPGLDVAVDGPVGRGAEAWWADARRLTEANDWRGALRCHYRALVAELAGAGLLEEVPGRTTGEYLAAVTSDIPSAADSFAAATRRFESAWYGHDEVGPDDVTVFAATAQRSLADAGIRRPAPVGAGT
jgi:hypothetical protein